MACSCAMASIPYSMLKKTNNMVMIHKFVTMKNSVKEPHKPYVED